VRRKISTANWKFPRRMTLVQWSRLSYRDKYWCVAGEQCTLLGYWRDCAKPGCRRLRYCLAPHPCYWDRKARMTEAEWAQADAACQPLRALLNMGSRKDSGSRKSAEGLWLF